VNAAATADDDRGPVAKELIDVVRGASGGLLFGVPLLYTMEVWWSGTEARPGRLIGVLAAAFLPVFLLNHTGGFRSSQDSRVSESLMDTVEALALGLVLSLAVLVLLREVTADTPTRVALGKVIYEAMPFCIGIGVAKHFLLRGRDEGDDGPHTRDRNGWTGTLIDVGATLLGSLFLALNIAPTDEVPMLASAMPPPWLLLLVAASLLISYAIVFVAGFAREDQRRTQAGILQHPVTETVVSYLLALGSAALMLWFFHRLSGPWHFSVSQIVVLGLPAAIGGAAGRLAA
jgi:putative integral membrane protein (TIGR02587 family)